MQRLSLPKRPPEAQHVPGLLLSYDPVRRSVDLVLDLIFPPRCAGCGKVDTDWCAVCQQELDQIPYPPLRQLDRDSPLTALGATGPHEGKLQQAVLALKFENNRRLAAPLGQRLVDRLNQLDWMIDIIVPVPLHMKRLHERGYNQSRLLADYLAQKRGMSLIPQAVHRDVETRSQVGLNARERQINVAGVFSADKQIVANQTLLLIDDVYTTGATLGACAQAALEAGATAVYGLTVSMA